MLLNSVLLQNRYRIVRQLGRGGMGTVYEAIDQRLSRTIALKETLIETHELRRAFEREAHLLANLNHPSLPRVIDHFTDNNEQYLAMDFIPGDDLKAILDKTGKPFPVDEVLSWANDLLDALDYLHSHSPPVIHRDIKPSNLKLTSKGGIVLLDFGLAKGTAGQMSAVTLSRTILGYSPDYASLEQMQGEKSSPLSDIYSFAATFYHLLTGVAPPDALTRATAVLHDESDPLRQIKELCHTLPSRIAGELMRSLSLNPASRPQSAATMRAILTGDSEVLEKHLASVESDEVTIVRSPASLSVRVPSRFTLSQRIISGLAALFVTALLIVGLNLFRSSQNQKNSAANISPNNPASPEAKDLGASLNSSSSNSTTNLVAPNNGGNSQNASPAASNAPEIGLSLNVDRTNDLPSIVRHVGKYPYQLFKAVPSLDQRLRVLLGANYKKFMGNLSVQARFSIEDSSMVSAGCAPHSCGSEEAALAIDLSNGIIHCVILSTPFDRSTLTFGKSKVRHVSEDKSPMPVALRRTILEFESR